MDRREFLTAAGFQTLAPLLADNTQSKDPRSVTVKPLEAITASESSDSTTLKLSSIAFKQQGNHSVIRTAQDKMRDVINVKDFGAIGDGTIDDTFAIQAAFNYAASINATQPKVRTVVDLGNANVFYVTSTIITNSISINGNGSVLYSTANITILQINGNNQVFENFHVRFDVEKSNRATIAIELTNGTLQASKNTYINIITRNAYHGFYNNAGLASSGSIWGSVFINCRADYSWDYGWHLNCRAGKTTVTLINCHAKGNLKGGSKQIKGYFFSGISELVLSNCAADQVYDGKALVVTDCQTVSIDIFTCESCQLISDNSFLSNFSAAQHLKIDNFVSKAGQYKFGEGNNGCLVQVSSGTNATIGEIIHISDRPNATGTLYKLRTNNHTRVSTSGVKLSETDTLGNYELFFDSGRIVGLATSDPSHSFTKTYEVGNIAINRSPAPKKSIGWVCVKAGTPGTWYPFGLIAPNEPPTK